MTRSTAANAFSLQRFLERWGVAVAFALLFAASCWNQGFDFLNAENIRALLNSNAPVGILAVGMTLVIISAGFDAHHRDPLGSLQLTEEDFDWVTLQLMEAAEIHCGGRVVSVLEGGYDLKALGDSVSNSFLALLGKSAQDSFNPAVRPLPSHPSNPVSPAPFPIVATTPTRLQQCI
jgi:hypothetical protein